MSLPPAVVDLVNFLIPASIFALMALALNVQWGHTGLFNAGVAAFWALGAYTAAILMTPPAPMTDQYPGHLGGYSQNFALALGAAMFVSALAGLLIAIPILRLRADYFGIATLALAEIVRLFLVNAQSITAGTIGVISIPRPFDAWIADSDLSDTAMAALAVGTLLLVFVLLEYVTRAPWGRVLRGIREDEEATLALGKDVFRFRLQAFVLGCALMGATGAISATFLRFITPGIFDPLSTFTIYVMLILGGSGNNRGAILGAFLYYAFDWISTRLDDRLPDDVALKVPALRVMAIGALLVILIIYRPEGILKEPRRTYPPVS
ncbi:MAG TPA: branched-chain amino acid ABC transporter permease [Thermoplasmata archaeon]|nr:branched-chain amino acid ABC transporter permease [Thermoplasmata archaeon]